MARAVMKDDAGWCSRAGGRRFQGSGQHSGAQIVDASNAAEFAPAGATDAGGSGDEAFTLGFIVKQPNDFFLAMEDAVEAFDASRDDVEVLFGAGQGGADIEGQIALIEDMLAQGVDGIAIAPAGPGVASALQSAIDDGVPVVLIDNDLPDDLPDRASYVGTDNFNAAVLAGEYIAEQLPAGSTLAIVECITGIPALADRIDGMIEGLGDADIEQVARSGNTDASQELGVSETEDILTRFPDVDAIYAACGPPVLGAIEAVDNAGIDFDDILIVGFDALPAEAEAILAGREDATVAQFPGRMGEIGLEALLSALAGDSVESVIDSGAQIVDASNAAEFTG